MANGIVTQKGREKMVQARAGMITLPPITEMAFGNGAVDADRTITSPSTKDNSLKNEIFRATVESCTLITPTSCRYSYRIKKGDLGGEKINEVALFDSEGDMVIVKAFSNKEKDLDMEMIFEIDDEF